MKTKLQNALKEAIKAKDRTKADTIRGLLSAIQYEEMEKKVQQLAADQMFVVLQREIKKRKEELEFADKAGRSELKEKLGIEMAVLEAFMPKQMDSAEIERIVLELKTKDPAANMGSVMKALKENFAGQYDAKAASEIVKKLVG